MTSLYKRIKYYLTEMSLDKKALEQDIRSKTKKINEHLLKCLLIQNETSNLNHWCNEIHSFLDDVPKLKGSNKLPNEKVLYNCTIRYFADSLTEKLPLYVEDVFEEENYSTDYNIQTLYACIIDYYEWLIPLLSRYGTIKNSQVKQQINLLIQKYNTETKQRQEVAV